MQRNILEEKWHEEAELCKQKAARLPHGKERDDALRMARQLETASHMNDWLSSAKVARQLNERPRETLQFETPAERFNTCAASTS